MQEKSDADGQKVAQEKSETITTMAAEATANSARVKPPNSNLNVPLAVVEDVEETEEANSGYNPKVMDAIAK